MADDAHHIDTTPYTLEEVVDQVVALVEKASRARPPGSRGGPVTGRRAAHLELPRPGPASSPPTTSGSSTARSWRVFGTRDPGGQRCDSVPGRGARFDFVYGAPGHWEVHRPWPRTQADVRRTTADLRNRFVEHLVEATACTGRELPGPLPQTTEKDVREARGVSRRTRSMTTEPTPEPGHVTDERTPTPVLAVVGRPNVGKSTLVNRMIGRREAVVQDVPGVTRDRVSYDATWNGRAFTVVDTGGWDPDARGLAEAIRAQAEIAVTVADAVLFVVDATVGITDADEAVVQGAPQVRQAGGAGGQQGRRPARRGGGLRAVEPRARRAAPGLGAARPRLGRHARRDPGRAARAAARVATRRSAAPVASRSSASRTSASPRC